MAFLLKQLPKALQQWSVLMSLHGFRLDLLKNMAYYFTIIIVKKLLEVRD